MKFTLSWLKEFLVTEATAADISIALTNLGLEVESVTDYGAQLAGFTVAEILDATPHPQADRLRVCRVLAQDGERTVVCGAPNARAGIKVILADIGITIPANGLVIKKSAIRGVESCGMLCSSEELGIGGDSEGIIELPAASSVGTPAATALGMDDVLFDIAITPNRGDCLGVYGIARDLAAEGIGTLKSIEVKPVPEGTFRGAGVDIQTPDCKHFILRALHGVRNAPSPDWLQQRLQMVGLRPISALVDITNYFSIAYGRPLHVYDAGQVQGGLVVRASQEGEHFKALNSKEYTLPAGVMVIADDAQVQGVAGIMGAENSGCTPATTDVLLEAAWFEPEAVAHAGRALQLESDARYRFERHVDPAFTAIALEMATAMVLELCGGEAGASQHAGEAPVLQQPIAFKPEMVETLTGISLPGQRIEEILDALGFTMADGQVTAPSWRGTFMEPAEFVEEIVRVLGYDAITPTPLPAVQTVSDAPALAVAERRLRREMAARGLQEVVHFAFGAAADSAIIHHAAEQVQVRNPISAELDTMRGSLLPSMLRAVARNLDRGHKNLGFFEAGTVFLGVTPESQPQMLAVVRTGHTPPHWAHKPHAYDVFDVKADALAALESLGLIARPTLTTDTPGWYHPGQSGRIGLGAKQTLGYFGALHPAVLRHFGIEQPVYVAEIWLEAVPVSRRKGAPSAPKFSDFQSVKRDFAFVVDAAMQVETIFAAMRGAEKKLLKQIDIFDVYAGKGIPEGKKSLAFNAVLQADDRTLTEEEITASSQAIIAAVQKIGGVLRS